jgi:hypothetical protein
MMSYLAEGYGVSKHLAQTASLCYFHKALRVLSDGIYLRELELIFARHHQSRDETMPILYPLCWY